MPYKDKKQQQEYMKTYNDKYYKDNKDYFLKRNKRLREDLKAMIRDEKSNKTCKYCDESESVCLDFNHREPEKKKFTISRAPSMKVTRKQLREEIEKCDLVCSNCHRKLHKTLHV